MEIKKLLLNMLLERSFKYADEPIFKLQSGKMSNYYIDVKQTTLHPEGAYYIGECVFDIIKKYPVEAVGGLTLGADPIALATCFASRSHNNPIYPFIVRKEPKAHGTGKRIEAAFSSPKKVAVLDDVITTGESTIKAIESCLNEGLEVLCVVCVIDRQEGGKERIEETYQIPVHPLFTKTELFESIHLK